MPNEQPVPEADQPVRELTPDEQAAQLIQQEQEKRLRARDEKEQAQAPASDLQEKARRRDARDEAERATERAKAVSRYWRLMEECVLSEQTIRTYVMDAHGGITIMTVVSAKDFISHSMVFMPGYETINDIIRKM